MITKTEGFKTSDGDVHSTIEFAQARELRILAEKNITLGEVGNVVEWIVASKDAILAILNPELPKKRTRKPRAAKTTTQQPLTP